MTRKPSPAVQLARDVLHRERCRVVGCKRCRAYIDNGLAWPDEIITLARALLRAVRP